MKFTVSVNINQPQALVAQLFADPANLKEYQPGFEKKHLVSGVEGQDGAVSKMHYKTGKREMELTETITSNRLPGSFEASYYHKSMDNTMKCSFKSMDEAKTQYDMEIEYTAFRGIIPKIMSILFPGIFKKQVEKWMNNFKEFAEKQDQRSI